MVRIFSSIYLAVTRPHESVRLSVPRREARLMAIIALTMFPVSVVALCLQVLVDPDRFWPAVSIAPGVSALAVTYLLARSRVYRLATWLTLLLSVAVIGRSIVEMPNDGVVYGYFLIPVILASAVLPLNVAFGVASACFVVITALCVYYLDALGDSQALGVLIMLSVSFVTVLLAAQHRRSVDQDQREDLGVRERRARALLQTAFGGMAVLQDDRIIECNIGFAALFGYRPEEALGVSASQLFPTARAVNFVGEHTAQHRDGSVFPVSLVSRDYQVAVGMHRVLAVQDLRDRLQLHAQLHKTDRMATMGQLAAGVAHEINNPLAWVVGNLSLMQQLDIGDPKVEALAKKANDGAKRVERIVRDLQTFSRMREPAPKAVDLHRSVHSAANMVRHRIRGRGSLIEDLKAAPTVDGDETRVGQVCLNLLVNAIEALDPAQRASNFIRLELGSDSAGNAVLQVTDNGKGMSPMVLRRIFDPFFTTKEEGTGLGLSITRSIADDLGAQLEVDSVQGVGTTMRIVFPPGMLAAPLSTTPMHGLNRVMAPAKILVVDDEQDICDLVKASLASHRVVSVNNVADALAAMEKEVFAVVVCDLMMPVQTGMDLYSKACASYPAMAGSFIFITGGAYTTEARAFLDQTTAPILEKPFRLNRMRDVVEDMILSEARGKASRVSRDGLIVLEHAEAEQQNQLSD